MFKSALRLGPKIKLISHNRRRYYNQASDDVYTTCQPNTERGASKLYVDSVKILPVSTGCCVLTDLAKETLMTSEEMDNESTCQLRALRAIDWLFGEQWQAGLLYLEETDEL